MNMLTLEREFRPWPLLWNEWVDFRNDWSDGWLWFLNGNRIPFTANAKFGTPQAHWLRFITFDATSPVMDLASTPTPPGKAHRHVKHPVLTFGVFLLSLWRSSVPSFAPGNRPAFERFDAEGRIAEPDVAFGSGMSCAIVNVVELNWFLFSSLLSVHAIV